MYFTNISNYFCFFVILTLWLENIKLLKQGEREHLTKLAPNFRLSTCVMIIITFLVYNVLLSNPFSAGYWTNLQSVNFHLVCPVLFVVDYMLFSKHRQVRFNTCFMALIAPAIYLLFIIVRAEVYVGTGKLAYPYYFLNLIVSQFHLCSQS